MKLIIFKDTKVLLPQVKINKLFNAICNSEAKKNWRGETHLIFTTDKKIRKINYKFRSINKPTDVLSFNIEKPLDDSDIFGEIYISVDTAKKQANEYEGTIYNEYLRLVCHGILHLFGYDHIKDRQRKIMVQKEKKYLGKIGVRYEY